MHSSIAKGEQSFLRKENARKIRAIVSAQAKRFGVRVFEFALVDHHIHLLARIASRKTFLGFLRAVSGLIARAVMRAERGAAKNLKFWDSRPFTRVLDWGRAFVKMKRFLGQSSIDVVGFIPYAGRGRPRKFDWRAISFAPFDDILPPGLGSA
jgi:REP element-mobilizing transposase RayT